MMTLNPRVGPSVGTLLAVLQILSFLFYFLNKIYMIKKLNFVLRSNEVIFPSQNGAI